MHKLSKQDTPVPASHKSSRAIRRHRLLIHISIVLGVVIVTGFWIYFFTPTSPMTVIPFIFIFSLLAFVLLGFLHGRLQFYGTLFVFLFLTINYFAGFDLLNTVLLLSFIIGLAILFK